HLGRRVQIELATRHGADPEAVPQAARDEDERARRASMRGALDEDLVLALEDVKRLRAVVVDVQRRAEIRWLRRLEEREHAAGLRAGHQHRHLEVAQVDLLTLAWSKHDRIGVRLHERPPGRELRATLLRGLVRGLPPRR